VVQTTPLKLVENVLRPLGSRHVYLSYEEHDLVTANTQAVIHAAFLRCIHTDFIFYFLAYILTAWELRAPLPNLTHGNKASTSVASKR